MIAKNPILITGGTGKLGRELAKMFPRAVAPDRSELDLCNRGSLLAFMRKRKPSTVIHAAAFTNVRLADEDKEKTWNTNVTGTENLIAACLEYVPKVYFVHVSTACVFPGDRGSYTENDVPNPKNYYSFTKCLSEFVVKRLFRYLIVRTNFVGREPWPYPKAFVDRFGTYLFSDQVAYGIREAWKKGLEGVVHIVGDRKMTMYELARLTKKDVQPMTMKEYSGPPLTVDMSLDTVRWKKYSISKRINL